MSIRRSVVSALGAAALAVVAVAGTPTAGTTPAAAPLATAPSGYVPGAQDGQNDRLRGQLAEALATAPLLSADSVEAGTVVYDDSQAPSYASEIATAVDIWNSSVGGVQFVEGSGATLDFYEGNDANGSYAYSDGRGNGYVFLDYAQTAQYDVQRVVTHEMGHTIGLPDTYAGSCSQLMSGGGPGPSCTNSYPDAAEVAQVDAIWAGSAAATPLAAFAR